MKRTIDHFLYWIGIIGNQEYLVFQESPKMVTVRTGFSWWTLAFSWPALMYRRLWIPALTILATTVAISFVLEMVGYKDLDHLWMMVIFQVMVGVYAGYNRNNWLSKKYGKPVVAYATSPTEAAYIAASRKIFDLRPREIESQEVETSWEAVEA